MTTTIAFERRLARWWGSDLAYNFRHSPVAVVSAVVLVICLGAAFFVLIFAIGISNWVQYARTVRGSTMVEKNKDYVHAARVIGIRPLGIMRRHLLPNVLGPVLVLATINIATAIITEATLSFLGIGVPPTQPSLGTLIRVGNDFLFSGDWWIATLPC